MEYPEFDNGMRDFGTRYIYDEWRPLIDAIFALSNPSGEESRSPSTLVEDATRTYGINFAVSADLFPTVSTSQPKPSQIAVRRPCHKASIETAKDEREQVS